MNDAHDEFESSAPDAADDRADPATPVDEPSAPEIDAGYETRYDPARDDSLVWAVVDAVATTADCDPLEVEPLYERVNPEALEALFEPRGSAPDRSGTVSFSLHGRVVTVVDGELIRVERDERHA